MVLTTLDPREKHELTFDFKIEGSKEEPTDIRFIIEPEGFSESQDDSNDKEETVQDKYSIICKAIRTNDSIKVLIPRLLNLFRSGSYKARIEVILEDRLFVPLKEEIEILEPTKVITTKLQNKKETHEQLKPLNTTNISMILSNMINNTVQEKKENTLKIKEVKTLQPNKPDEILSLKIDSSWRTKGFQGLKNPF